MATAFTMQYTFCDSLALPVTRIGDAMHILKVLIGDKNTQPVSRIH